MNYAYDILQNYKDNYFDFYEWNTIDGIVHIRKIPIFKISTDDILNIKNNKVIFDKAFLKRIENKTEIFTKQGIKNIKYACLFMNDEIVLGINNKKISSLLIDEELDILEQFYNLDEISINYKILKVLDEKFKTRKQMEIENKVKKELSKIDSNDKLKYLYYECFNIKEDNVDKVKMEFKKLNKSVVEKLYNIFKMIKIKNE